MSVRSYSGHFLMLQDAKRLGVAPDAAFCWRWMMAANWYEPSAFYLRLRGINRRGLRLDRSALRPKVRPAGVAAAMRVRSEMEKLHR